jgi:hypothetical protein
MMYKWIKDLLVVALVTGMAVPVAAQEEEPAYDDNARDCINLRQIRRTEVVDDRNILFHMTGSVVYHNILPRQCGGLAREDRFSYQTSIGRLCRLDHIRVLYNDPFGLREGNRCSLGMFHKITKEDAKAFTEEADRRGPEANPLPLPEPGEIGEQQDESEEPEGP